MNVKIFSDLSGEMQFDMPEEKVMQLIGTAMVYAGKALVNAISQTPAYRGFTPPAYRGFTPPPPPETKKEKPVSKIERMFGDVRGRIPVEAVSTPLKKQDEEYKGFLLIECEGCGKLRGYYAKYPTAVYHCDCGHATPLRELRPAHLHCKCGSSFKYLTNVQKSKLTYRCLDCGAPVDLEINKSGTTFVTVGYNRF